MAGDPFCSIHGFSFCHCMDFPHQRFCQCHGWGGCGCTLRNAYEDVPLPFTRLTFESDTKKSIPTLTPFQATTLYQLMAASVVGGYWVPDKEEYDAIKEILWAISENKEC